MFANHNYESSPIICWGTRDVFFLFTLTQAFFKITVGCKRRVFFFSVFFPGKKLSESCPVNLRKCNCPFRRNLVLWILGTCVFNCIYPKVGECINIESSTFKAVALFWTKSDNSWKDFGGGGGNFVNAVMRFDSRC